MPRRTATASTLTALSIIAASAWSLGQAAPASAANVTSVTVTVTNTAGEPVPNAFAAVVTSSGEALGGGTTSASGVATITIASTDNASLVVKAGSPDTGSVTDGTVDASGASAVSLPAATITTGLTYSNTFGAQVRRIAGDAQSGTFYATTDNIPAVWRTSDYGGTWAPVPTLANSTSGLPQQSASEIVTSGYPGEVAVAVQSGVYYSRDFGSTWSAVPGFMLANGGSLMWAHNASTSGGFDSSYLMIHSTSGPQPGLFAAVIPSANNGLSSASVSNVALVANANPTGPIAALKYALAPGVANGLVYLLAAGSGASTMYAVAPGQTAGTSVLVSGNANNRNTLGYGIDSSTDDLVMLTSKQTDNTWGIVLYDRTGGGASSATMRAINLATAGTVSASVVTTGSRAIANNTCGENETTPVGALINSELGAGVPAPFTGMTMAGAIRGCYFTFDGTNLATAAINGINNNTGFVFDSGFSNANQVVIAGDGQFGLRKSAQVLNGAFDFGQAGGMSQNASYFLQHQADPGTAPGSSGIAVVGMVNPVVRDLAYSPNDTTGNTYVVSTSSTGGSQMLLTTDAGASFSTMSGSGSDQIAWWNGTGSNQWIVGGAPLSTSQFFRVKQFTATNGTGPQDMGQELAATATQRNDYATGLPFILPDNAATKGGQPYGTEKFGSALTNGSLTALEGVPGTDRAIVGISSGASEGTVAVLDLDTTPNAGTQDAMQPTIGQATYYGTVGGYTGTGSTASPAPAQSSTFDKSVNAIAVCPNSNSVAADVRDTAFIAVEASGIYKLTSVSGTPTLVAPTSPNDTQTYNDIKVDCDTGIVAGVTDTALTFSLDAISFQAIDLPAPLAGMLQNSSAVALAASGPNDQVTIGVGAGMHGNLTAVSMAITDLLPPGETIADLTAGTAMTPVTPVIAPADDVTVLNDARPTGLQNDITAGKDVGLIPALDFPEALDSVVRSSFAKIMMRAKRLVSYRTSTTLPLAIGSGAGSFNSSATNANGGSGGGGDSGGGSSGPTPSPSPTPTATATPVAATPVEQAISNPTQVTPIEFRTLTPAEVATIPPASFAQLPTSVIAVITPAQFRAVTPQQLGALPAASIPSLSPTVFDVMSPTQVRALAASLMAQITASQAANFQPSTARVMTWDATRSRYSGSQINALQPAAVAALTPSVMRVLIGRQVAAFRVSAFSVMRPAQAAVLAPKQVAFLTAQQISRWPAATVKALRPGTLAALSDSQAKALTPGQRRGLSAAQRAALG